jgi:hypothetical protein
MGYYVNISAAIKALINPENTGEEYVSLIYSLQAHC